jgi:hypothetical protein
MSEGPDDTRTPNGTNNFWTGCGCLSSVAVFIIGGLLSEVYWMTDSIAGIMLLAVFGGIVLVAVAALKPRTLIVSEPHTPSVSELRRMPYGEYLQTPHWQHKREEKLRAMGYRCQLCNRASSEAALDVHHRTYERRGEERDEDLTVLCRECHYRHHEHGRRGR